MRQGLYFSAEAINLFKRYVLIVVPLVGALIGLYFVGLHNYLLFHSLAEGFSIVIACGIFMIAWNARRYLHNHYLLFIGIAYLYVGGIDFLHTLSYQGMSIFAETDSNLPTQLWIAGRYMEALSLLAATFFLDRKIRPRPVLAGFGVFTALLLASIFYRDIFPDCYIEGQGLTPFKIYSEYVICVILFAVILILVRHSKNFNRNVLILIIAALLATIAQELAFTKYLSVYGPANTAGHLFKIVSFYLIYKAVIHTSLNEPWNLLFRDLKLSEAKFRSIFDSDMIPIAYCHTDGRLMDANNEYLNLLGLTHKDLSTGNARWDEATPPEWKHIDKTALDYLSKDGICPPLEKEYQRKDGTRVPVLLGATRTPEHSDQIIVFSVDLTERKQFEQALKQSESRFRLLSETANRLLESDNPQEVINDLCRKVMEYLDCQVFFNFLVDEQVGKLRLNACAGISEEEIPGIEWLESEETVCGSVAQVGERIIAEDIFHASDVRPELAVSYGLQAYACHPLVAQGLILGTLSFGTRTRKYFSTDDLDLMETVADQVSIALERIRFIEELKIARENLKIRVRERTSDLEHAYRDLADFNFIAVHDLQEPLRILVTLGDRLAEKLKESSDLEGKYYVERMQNSAQRASHLIRDIHRYSMVSSQNEPKIKTGLMPLVENALSGFEAEIAETGALIEVAELASLKVSPSQMTEVFSCLISNALKFNNDKPPSIRIGGHKAPNGREFHIYVKDNGIGFDEVYLDKIFTPFQRLDSKSRFEGRGIGLAVCRKVIEKHRGSITAVSNPGEGSTFIISLPMEPFDQ